MASATLNHCVRTNDVTAAKVYGVVGGRGTGIGGQGAPSIVEIQIPEKLAIRGLVNITFQ